MEDNQNQYNDLMISDQSILHNNNSSLEIVKLNSNSTKNKVESGYSSFISQRNIYIRTSSPVVIHPNINKVDSPVTSYGSRNSGLFNDDELEEMFYCGSQFPSVEKNAEKSKESSFHLFRDLDLSSEMSSILHPVRNSPRTVRPESTPLNEEDEDSDKEASSYSSSFPRDPPSMARLPELIQCCTLQCTRSRYSSTSESEQRNEIIASKLREIADKLDSSNKVRTRNHSTSSDSIKSTSNRHSRSSFADVLPCCGSAVDLFLSLYSVYKSHSKMSNSTTVVSSQSTANISQIRNRVKNRCRSYTQ